MAYRHYVLLLLLLVYIHCLLSRMLPAFLVSVPVPGCKLTCAGTIPEPLCHRPDSWPSPTGLAEDEASYAECQRCRARVGAFSDEGKDGNWFNMADGACLEQWQYGLLMGYGFAIPFVLGSLLTASTVDSVDRRTLLAIMLASWSSACGMMAAMSSFWPLLICRLILGMSEAPVVPAAMSLITQYFDEGSQGSAGSILSAGVCLGAGAASWAVPLALHVGWREACVLVSGVGAALSLLVFTTVREPAREVSAACRGDGASSGISPAVRLLTAAASFRLAASYTLAAFLPVYYLRAQLPGYTPATYATANAAIVASTGLVSALVGGAAADYLGVRYEAAPCIVAASAQVVAMCMFIGVFSAETFSGSLLYYGAALLIGECWYGLMLVQVKGIVPREVQGKTITLVLSVATIVSNLGPSLVGALSSATEVGLHSIMLALITGCVLLAACLLMAAAWEIEYAQSWQDEEFVPPLLSQPMETPDSSAAASPHSMRVRSLSFVHRASEVLLDQARKQISFTAPGEAQIFFPEVALEASQRMTRGRSCPMQRSISMPVNF